MATPPLPPGFVLESDVPPLPAGFVLEAPDFSGATGGVTGSTYDQPKPRRTLPEIATRAAGLTGRSMAQGVGGLVDFAAEGARMNPLLLPGRAALALMGQPDLPQLNARGAIEQRLTQVGVPQPETAPERVISGVGEALTGAGLTAGLGGLPRAGLQLASAGTGATAGELTREAGGSPRLQTLAGLAGGLIPGLGMGRGARMPSGAPEQAIVQKAAARGIPLRPAGVTGGKTTQALRSVPGAGAKGRYESDVGQFNRALSETIGSDQPVMTRQANAAKAVQDTQTLNTIMARNAMAVDAPFVTALNDVLASAKGSKVAERAIQAQIDDLMASSQVVNGKTVIPGTAYQRLDSQLGRIGKIKNSAQPFVQDLRAALRTQMDNSISPEDAQTWATWRQQYGDRKAIQKLIAESGDRPIDPRKLMQAVMGKDFNSQGRMATGRRGELGELADIGQLIEPPTPTSVPVGVAGTAALGGGALANAPATAGLYGLLNLAGRAADRAYLPQGNRLQTLGQGIPGIVPALAPFRFDQQPYPEER